jgi:hypothetical protein
MSGLENNDTTDNRKSLDFWDFEALKDPSKQIERKSPFPTDRLVTRKEMDFYFEKLWGRISKYKDNKCFHFLEGYYNFTKETYESGSVEEAAKSFDRSHMCLKLFTYCWELDKKENPRNLARGEINENKNLM